MRDDIQARESAAAWSLRAAWGGRWPVVVRLDERAVLPRVSGYVEHVAASGAFVLLEELDGEPIHVPCAHVLSVRRPHFHEPGDRRALAAPDRGPRETVLDTFPGQLSLLPDDAGVPPGATG